MHDVQLSWDTDVGVSQIGGAILGVPIIRTITFWNYVGVPKFRKLPCEGTESMGFWLSGKGTSHDIVYNVPGALGVPSIPMEPKCPNTW